MAQLLWGKVFYQENYVGLLRQGPGDQAIFEYDDTYLNQGLPAISYSLPTVQKVHTSFSGLHPFFDNLVSEGWLENAQTRLLGRRTASRFELLLAFGYDCAGAVSVMDPEPQHLTERLLDLSDTKELSLFTSRASLSGVQPKLPILKKGGAYVPAKIGELSTHIAKFSSSGHPDLILNEALTTLALRALLPKDRTVDVEIGEVQGLSEPALVIKRFDRSVDGRLHFEEFNQLLNHSSRMKYEGSYQDMADFMRSTPLCLPIEVYRLFERIIAGLLLGNTDMHFKNFAMFHTPDGLRLTPSYDTVGAYLYQYKTIALEMGGAKDLNLGGLKPKHILSLGESFGLSKGIMRMSLEMLSRNKDAAKDAIAGALVGGDFLKDQLIKQMERRWNGSFASIGMFLSRKP